MAYKREKHRIKILKWKRTQVVTKGLSTAALRTTRHYAQELKLPLSRKSIKVPQTFLNRNPQLENVNETLSWQRQEDIISYSLVDIYKFKKLMICSKKGSRMKEGIALVWKINT